MFWQGSRAKAKSCPEGNPYLNGLIRIGDERLFIHTASKEGALPF
jgi:hypothetical protein